MRRAGPCEHPFSVPMHDFCVSIVYSTVECWIDTVHVHVFSDDLSIPLQQQYSFKLDTVSWLQVFTSSTRFLAVYQIKLQPKIISSYNVSDTLQPTKKGSIESIEKDKTFMTIYYKKKKHSTVHQKMLYTSYYCILYVHQLLYHRL